MCVCVWVHSPVLLLSLFSCYRTCCQFLRTLKVITFCSIRGSSTSRGHVAQLSHCLGALTPILKIPDTILCDWPHDWDHIITIIRKLTSGYYQSNPPKPKSIWFEIANESVNVLCPGVMDTQYGWHEDIIYQLPDWLRFST